MAESTQNHRAMHTPSDSSTPLDTGVIGQLNEHGSAVLSLVSQMAEMPIQEALFHWVFEQQGQNLAASDGLSTCQSLQLAEQPEPGMWQFDRQKVASLVSGTELQQRVPEHLKQAAVQFYNLAVDNRIEATLVNADLSHIHQLSMSPDSEEECDLLIWLADFAYQQGDASLAAECWQGIFHYLQQSLGNNHEDTLLAMNNLAESLRGAGLTDDAKALYKQQLSVSTEALGPDHSTTLTAMNNLASMLREAGDLLGARQIEEEVLNQRRQHLGEDHPETLICMGQFAATLKAMGNYDDAMALQRQVLEKNKQQLPPEHPQVTEAAWNLVQSLLAQGDYDAMQDILFDDLFWLISDSNAIQSQSQLKIRDLLQQLLSKAH